MPPRLVVDREKLIELCRRNHIRRLAFFGSVLRDDFGPDSDVDVLVEFEPGHTPGLDFFRIQDELSDLLGRKVDMLTFREIQQSRNYIRRRHVLGTAEEQYVA